MKFLCVLALSAAVVQCLESDCRAQSRISEDLVKKFSNDVYVDDPTVKEYTLCMMKAINFVDDSGEFLVDNIKKKFRQVISDEDTLESYIRKCTVKQETPQQTAFKTMKCFYENRPKSKFYHK